MAMNDLVSDLVARLKNGHGALLPQVRCKHSNLVEGIVKVLQTEGYVEGYSVEEPSKNRKELLVNLKYHEGEGVIKKINRVSSPGRRVYTAIEDLGSQYNGLGIAILSTSKGVMSDFDAKSANIGGEVLCTVF